MSQPNPPKRPKKSIRGTNFTIEEDNQLCESWIAKSIDPDDPIYQKGTDAWKNILEHYKTNFKSNSKVDSPVRVDTGIYPRWQTIQREVSKFCVFYQQAKSQLDSSEDNTESQLMLADSLYRKGRGKHFAFYHCWKILRNNHKWLYKIKDAAIDRENIKKRTASSKERPEKPKKQKVFEKKSASIELKELEYNSIDVSLFLRNSREKNKLLQRALDLKILNTDLSKINDPRIVAYFQYHKNEVLDRFEAERNVELKELIEVDDDVIEEIESEVEKPEVENPELETEVINLEAKLTEAKSIAVMEIEDDNDSEDKEDIDDKNDEDKYDEGEKYEDADDIIIKEIFLV